MMSTHSSPFISIIHLQRLKQLDAAFGTTRSFVDINQLAEVFVCSERNASKLMNTLASKGYVSWTPGRGRGNKSAITLPQPFDVLLLKQLESQVRTGQINEAFAHAEHFQKRTVLQEKLPLWLDETNAAVPPLNAWLTDAYPEATVTGAVFMCAFTTKTAIYVLLRGFPGTEILIWLGTIMAVYGVIYAVLENDCRRLLAYHIVSQVGTWLPPSA